LIPEVFLSPSEAVKKLRPANPFWIIAFFFLLALGVLFFRLPEKWTAGLAIGFFLSLTALHPLNGISFLLLVIPFFLGNPFKPYIYLLEIFIYGTLVSAFFHWRSRERQGPSPLLIPLGFWLLAAALSLPLDARELYYTLWASSGRDLFYQWLGGNPGYPVHFFRILFNLVSAVGLFYVTVHWLEKDCEPFLVKTIQALVCLAAFIAIVGLLFLFQWIPRGRSYLSLSLAGVHEGALSAFAFNRQFLAQYFLLCLPFAVFLIRRQAEHKKYAGVFLATGATFLLVAALAGSLQRSAVLVLFLQACFFLAILTWIVPGSKTKPRMLWLAPLGMAAGLFLLDWLVFDHRFVRRLQFVGTVQDIRPQLWRTAWAMFLASPFLGVGLGRYYALFPDFFPGLPEAWREFNVNRGNAHSIFIQPLAEQGILGFLCFLLLAGVILTIALKMLSRETEKERLWLGLSVTIALITWLTLGLFHHLAYDLRSLEIFFWIFSGFLLVLARRTAGSFRPGKKLTVGILLALTAALAYQLKLVTSYPMGEHFQVGFYHWEQEADGSRVRWMGQRAAAILPEGPGELILELRAPLPEVEQRPQQVHIQLDQRTYALTLADREWRRLALPLSAHGTHRHLISLETAYTFNPARSFGSRDSRNLGIQLKDFERPAL
jgi:putative inorganic carbon (hco3(-)) transporter